MAGLLAMCLGLVACGGSGSSSAASSSTASSSAATSSATASSSAASSTADITNAIFWEGTLPDGSTVCYVDNSLKGEAAISIAKSDYADAKVWAGPVNYVENGVATIAGANTEEPITFTIVDVTANSFTIDLTGYGQVELKPVSEADIKAYAEKLAEAAAAEGEKLLKEIEEAGKALEAEITAGLEQLQAEVDKATTEFNNLDEKTVFYWDGTLADGSSVTYMDNPDEGKAFLCIVKKDLSGGAAWYGKTVASQDGKIVTITDDKTGATVSYEIVESTPGDSMKMSIKAFGDGDLKAVTKADLTKFAEDLSKSMTEGEGAAK